MKTNRQHERRGLKALIALREPIFFWQTDPNQPKDSRRSPIQRSRSLRKLRPLAVWDEPWTSPGRAPLRNKGLSNRPAIQMAPTRCPLHPAATPG